MLNIDHEHAKLLDTPVRKLRERYADLFGEQPHTKNKAWLVKRILWRMQVLREGDITERALKRAEELANDADLRVIAPKDRIPDGMPEQVAVRTKVRMQTDDRLPPPGTVLTRKYKGESIQVMVLADGFEHEGKAYPSLSAVAKAVTGTHCNGFAFFNLNKKERQS